MNELKEHFFVPKQNYCRQDSKNKFLTLVAHTQTYTQCFWMQNLTENEEKSEKIRKFSLVPILIITNKHTHTNKLFSYDPPN